MLCLFLLFGKYNIFLETTTSLDRTNFQLQIIEVNDLSVKKKKKYIH